MLFLSIAYSLIFIFMIFLILLMWRNTRLYVMMRDMINEEGKFLSDLMAKGKYIIAFRRHDSLPSYDFMLFRFWIPLKKFRKPLSEYYKDCIGQAEAITKE